MSASDPVASGVAPAPGLVAGLRSRFGRKGGEEAAAVEAALRSDRFRLEREGDWKRLEAIVARMESGRLRRLSDGDVQALPALYRTVASSLSVARETSLDAATLAYLEALVSRAWFLVYGPRLSLWGWLGEFFGGGWARSVRALFPEVLLAFLVLAAGAVAGWAAVAADPSWFAALAGEFMDQRRPGASRAVLRGVLFSDGKHAEDDAWLPAFAAYLFQHNATVAIHVFALGFLCGIPSVLLLAQNGGTLGAMLWLYHGQGLTLDMVGWLSIHGTTELSAVILAGAAGLHIGRAVAFPGDQAVVNAAAMAGRRAAPVMLGAVLMLIVAAVLEGLFRQLVNDTPARLTIGWGIFAGWVAYFSLSGRGKSGGGG